MTDDEILETIDRRLAGVETRLPPTRVAPAAGLIAGRTRLGGTMRPGPSALLVLAVVTVVAVGVGSRLSGGVGGEASPSGVDPSAVAVASDVPPSAASLSPSPTRPPSPSAADLEVIRDTKYDGDHVLIQRMRWGPCMVGMDVLISQPDGAAVDRVIDRDGIDEGWVDLDGGGRVWVGSTPESAARAYGSPVLAIGGRGDTWILLGAHGRQLVSFQTPKGRSMWVLTGGVRECP